jgi:hypothetical protein
MSKNLMDQIELNTSTTVSMVCKPLTPELEASTISSSAPYIAIIIGESKYIVEHLYGSMGCAPRATGDCLVIRWNCRSPFTAVLPDELIKFRDLTYQVGHKHVIFELSDLDKQEEFERKVLEFQNRNPIEFANLKTFVTV